MKKKDKKKMIYDAMGLRLAVAFELSLGALPISANIVRMNDKVKNLCEYLRAEGADESQIAAVNRVVGKRNRIAHPRGNTYRPYLTEQNYKKMREDCKTIDELFMRFFNISPKKLPTGNILFHSLPYDMGNAGDLIKHGALAHFVRWWFVKNGNNRPFGFADPFGGCPWEDVENPEIRQSLKLLEKADSDVAKCLWHKGRYYNSGHIVNVAARQCDGKAMVRTSDNNDIARGDLIASSIYADDMELLKAPDHKHDDGYSILPNAGDFDLVLLDPFGDLLGKDICQFQKIRKAACDNPKTAIMVFVLDMQPFKMPPRSAGIWKRHDRYLKERDKLDGMAFSLRCREAIPTKDGTYDAEILLISKEFAQGGGEKLRKQLAEFAKKAKAILKKDTIMWGK